MWNRHPGGGFSGDGTSPCRTTRWRRRSTTGLGTGTAEMSAFVYGIRGWSYTARAAPSSTSFPRYMTATRVDVCLYDATGERETARLTLPGRTGPVHHGFVERELARVGTLYGIRVHGAYDPREGYRFNANKLLIDPWARDIVGEPKWSPSTLGFDPTDEQGQRPSLVDSAA